MSDFKNNRKEQEPEHSVRVKAGKRTYFFDVRETHNNSKYITITESKKRKKRGSEDFFYERHKIFLYGEDFETFIEALSETVKYVRENSDEEIVNREDYNANNIEEQNFNLKPESDSMYGLDNPEELIGTKDDFLNKKESDNNDFNADTEDDTELKWD